MASPPRSDPLNPASEPESFPMGVRAPLMMTDPAMSDPLAWLRCGTESTGHRSIRSNGTVVVGRYRGAVRHPLVRVGIPLAAALLLWGLNTWATSEGDPSTDSASSRSTESGPVTFADLPPEAADTYALVRSDGPFPYDRDGTVFSNFEGLLPERPRGQYREYTVPTPGQSTRGARRLVVDADGAVWYTADHYASFVAVETDSWEADP